MRQNTGAKRPGRRQINDTEQKEGQFLQNKTGKGKELQQTFEGPCIYEGPAGGKQMNADEYKKLIEGQMYVNPAGLAPFEIAIQISSEVLAERDRVISRYIADGCSPVLEETHGGHVTGTIQNPLLQVIQELDDLADTSLLELCIDPIGRKLLRRAAIDTTQKRLLEETQIDKG